MIIFIKLIRIFPPPAGHPKMRKLTIPRRVLKTSQQQQHSQHQTDKLYPHQKKNFSDVLGALERYRLCYNSSEMGLGKTHVMACVAKNTDKFMFVIGPDNIRDGWNSAFDYHGVTSDKYKFVGYNSFLCRKKSLFLQDPYDETVLCPSQEFEDLVNQPGGIHLVFDEAHMIKNDGTHRFKYCNMLTRMVTRSTESTLTLLSASPLEVDNHAYTICRLFGLMGENHDINTLKERCIKLFGPSIIEDQLIPLINLFDWFDRVIVPKLFFYMDPIPHKMEIDNQFIRLNPSDLADLSSLQNPFDKESKLAYYYATRMDYAERAKVKANCSNFIRTLEKDPNCKVIVMLNYTASIEYLADRLRAWNPIIVSGDRKYKTSVPQRNTLIDEFQEPNLKRRVIIGNMQMLGFGIDLDDKHGDYTRYVWLSATDKHNNIYQASKRVDRGPSTKSTAYVKIMYITGLKIDQDVLARTMAKSGSLKSILRYKSTLPGELEIDEDMFEQPTNNT